MLTLPDFQAFPKITRLYGQDIVISEKLDGTNALVFVSGEDGTIRAGSRNRWISVGDDNYGFASWVAANEGELSLLGPGYHYGEWWGNGIQRNYAMTKKVFSLFNTHRWSDEAGVRPACCDVVPVVYRGPFSHEFIRHTEITTSPAALKYGINFEKPEGTMCYLEKAGIYLKNPHDKDEQ